METSALLDPLLYRFRDLFGSQNFYLFCAYVVDAKRRSSKMELSLDQ